MATAMIASQALLCNHSFPVIKPYTLTSSVSPFRFCRPQQPLLSPSISTPTPFSPSPNRRFCSLSRPAARRKPTLMDSAGLSDEGDSDVRRLLRILLWATEAVYILWLFILPYAPGDPVWAISSETVNSLLGLSLNFFLILPAMNSVGIRLIDAPVLHPMSEGLFNFVIAWTLMFAPLLFTDQKRNRYSGSLDLLWGLQMFLTNTFLIPYMAIRLNEASKGSTPQPQSKLGSLMTNGAPVVGLIGGATCIISIIWSFVGRGDGNFGGVAERCEFLIQYLSSER
ncbi:uncharacterized protein LOC120075963 isoform X2 [Benincasa hispida]|nr:uncharacterized protein LOC120075963 isoform X2 [Benincasa hispida]